MVAEALACTCGSPGDGIKVMAHRDRLLWDLAERHSKGTFRPRRGPESCPTPCLTSHNPACHCPAQKEDILKRHVSLDHQTVDTLNPKNLESLPTSPQNLLLREGQGLSPRKRFPVRPTCGRPWVREGQGHAMTRTALPCRPLSFSA